MPLTAVAMRAMMRQLQEVEAQPVDGVQLQRSDDLSAVRFALDGPEGTPFARGRFVVALLFDEHYPAVPPRGIFETRIFHPNISTRGEVCVNALKRDWQSSLGLRHILLVIRCLLVEPNPESALNEEAGRLLLEDYAAYARKAAMLTEVYARRPDGVPRFGATSTTATGSSSSGSSSNNDDVTVTTTQGAGDVTHTATSGGSSSNNSDVSVNERNNTNNNNGGADVAAVAAALPKKTTMTAEKKRSNALRRL